MELYTAFSLAAQQYANRPALVWDEGVWSYKKLLQEANAAAHFLQKKFNHSRRNIALLSTNSPLFCCGLFGILGAGETAVPLNPLLTSEEMSRLLAHAEVPLLLYEPMLEEKAKQAVDLAGIGTETLSIAAILQVEPKDISPIDPMTDANDVAMILYTSGTSGDPKGVVLSHNNIYANYKSFTTVLVFGREDTFLCILPLFHTYAMTTVIFGAMLNGARVILYPMFSPQKVLEAIVREPRVNIIAVPPMLHLMTRYADKDIAERHNLNYVVSGGGPLPTDVTYAFEKKFRQELLEGYGLTEAAPVVAVNHPGQNKIGTIGPPLPDIEAEIRNESGITLKTNEIGELCVRGPNVMLGYYKNPTATREVFYEGGWLRTGDMALIDEDGHIKIVGRLKDTIVSGGENIYPREIEETLVRYPGVLEAAVIGKPNPLRTEIPHAFVVLSEDVRKTVTESDLRKFCREHLAEFKVPDGFTVIELMPKTAKGTIHKDALKKQFFSTKL